MYRPFYALSSEKRRKILELLSKKPLSSTEISKHFDIYHHAVSKHLRILLEAELVKYKRVGTFRIYSLDKKGLKKAISFIDRILSQVKS